MATAKQIEANRLNARKSTGPRTAAGRSASSLNAYKHGLTGQTLIMTEEQAEARERFITSMVDDLRPAGAMEAQLARSVADTHWRINRAVAIEENIFAHEAWAEENQVVKMAAQLGQESDYNRRLPRPRPGALLHQRPEALPSSDDLRDASPPQSPV